MRLSGPFRPLAAALAFALAVSSLAMSSLAVSPVFAQAPDGGPRLPQGAAPGPGGQQAPDGPAAAQPPGPDTEIIGPDGSFRLKPDGVNWARFQNMRAIGVRCTDTACGGERVFCMIQVKGEEGAKAGAPTSRGSADAFGQGILRSAPKELTAAYVAPFAEKTLGANAGQWAEVKAEGEPGSLRFGLFLTNADKHLVAFNCVSPSAKWDDYKPKIEGLIASLQITK